MNSSNQGFLDLQNEQGITLIFLSGVLLLAMIVFGVLVAKMIDRRDKEYRAELKSGLDREQGKELKPRS